MQGYSQFTKNKNRKQTLNFVTFSLESLRTFIVYPIPNSTIIPKNADNSLDQELSTHSRWIVVWERSRSRRRNWPARNSATAHWEKISFLSINSSFSISKFYSDFMLATKCLDGKSSRSRGNSWRKCSFADEESQRQTDRGGESSSEIALDVSRWRDLGENIPSRLTSLSSSWCVVQPVVRQWEKDKRERRAAITGNHTVDMIISKDLFLFGDQDYLRLPSNEKRQQRAMGRPIINAPRWVILSLIIRRLVYFSSDKFF